MKFRQDDRIKVHYNINSNKSFNDMYTEVYDTLKGKPFKMLSSS